MKTGDKVVCIDGKFDSVCRKLYGELPTEGQTYVIRDVRLGIQLDCKTGDVSILLIGIKNPHADSRAGLEMGFRSSRFRPLDDIKNIVRVADALTNDKELIPT